MIVQDRVLAIKTIKSDELYLLSTRALQFRSSDHVVCHVVCHVGCLGDHVCGCGSDLACEIECLLRDGIDMEI